MWDFLSAAAVPFIVAVVRGAAPDTLSSGQATSTGPEAAGRQLITLVFGPQDGQGWPDLLAGLAGNHQDQEALTELELKVGEAFEADPATASQAAAVIAAFHRQRADAGEVRALVELGDFLYWDEQEAARAAYQEALDAGYLPVLIDLARLLHNLLEEEAALAALERAAASGDADLLAEAMYEIAFVHVSHRDADAARAMFDQVLATRHPVWAGAAMVGLAGMLNRTGDPERAEALYREAAEAGNADWSGHALCSLGSQLRRKGDPAGAQAAWQRVIESRHPEWARVAFTDLVNLLVDQHDASGVRAAYLRAAELGTADAPYALVQLGGLLADQGDADGARAAWQQAIDAGCEDPDYVRELMDPAEPEPEPEAPPYPPHLPPEFNPANIIRAGISTLEHGLPPLPAALTYDMAIPMAYWEAGRCAVVLTLSFSRHGHAQPEPMAMEVIYSRGEDGQWVPPKGGSGFSFHHDPVRSRERTWHPDEGPVLYGGSSQAPEVTPGYPASIATGSAAPEVRYLAVIQDGHEDRRPLESHFGAWVVCTEQPGPFEVVGLDADGTVLARLPHPFRPPSW